MVWSMQSNMSRNQEIMMTFNNSSRNWGYDFKIIWLFLLPSTLSKMNIYYFNLENKTQMIGCLSKLHNSLAVRTWASDTFCRANITVHTVSLAACWTVMGLRSINDYENDGCDFGNFRLQSSVHLPFSSSQLSEHINCIFFNVSCILETNYTQD